ncbi:extracellular solute-binding protein [Patescibacteria group bacterium]|nr:extracellular solute-binding protein [Patescibacteria group bacterium]MBU2220190.1 extracellular solute-binding protein [Patescibacteria group bacterium]
MDKTKIIIFAVVGLIIIIAAAVIIINPFRPETPTPISLEFWSVFDDSTVFQPLILKYQQLYPHVTINYYKKNVASYEQELIDALAAGRGPDIFSIHNTWLPKHKDKLASAPNELILPARFNEVFVDVAGQDFIDESKIYALPLSVDSLALFYNKDLFNSAGLTGAPKTWAEFNLAVEKLAKRDAQNNILQAGAAIGTAKNINRSTDILMALMLQSGAPMVSDDRSAASFDQSVSSVGGSFNPGQQALIFYTNFANPSLKVYTWNSLQHYSIDAFVEGRAAMMFNYAYNVPLVRVRSPHLNFSVAALPQISLSGNKITFANYWAPAVSKSSVNQGGAWQFISWLASQENSREYLATTQKPAARRDLIDEQKADADLGIFAQQALYASSWWEIDNLAIEGIFAEMIELVTDGRASISDALQRASIQVTALMRK